MASEKICGVLDRNNPTVSYYGTQWAQDIHAYNGMSCDSIYPGDQGCKGKQLPGDDNTFYFIAIQGEQIGPTKTFLVKAVFNPNTTTYTITYKELPTIVDGQTTIVTVPKPNQLTVTTAGRVFMPVGSYDTPLADNKAYYFDITNTLDSDPVNWTITARYTVTASAPAIDTLEGTFCMCLSLDETKISMIVRGKDTNDRLYVNVFHRCDADGSNPESYANSMSNSSYRKVPLNIEIEVSGPAIGTYVFIGPIAINGTTFHIWAFKTSMAEVNTESDVGRAVAWNSTTGIDPVFGPYSAFMTIDNINLCTGAPNSIKEYAVTNVVDVFYLSVKNMKCPQSTPLHLDIYLPSNEAWTASGLINDVNPTGSVRQNDTPDRNSESGYHYPCTAAPRAAVVP